MNRKIFDDINSYIKPSTELVEKTKQQIRASQPKKQSSIYRRVLLTAATIILCLSMAVTATANFSPSIYSLMYGVSPEIAQFFAPVQKSCVDNGIKMEVISAYIHDNTAEIYISMQDLTGDRIDESIDLFDSYDINSYFDSYAHCEKTGYDPTTKTATFLITISQRENGKDIDISGRKIKFTVKEFLSKRKEDLCVPIAFDLSTVKGANELYTLDSGGLHPQNGKYRLAGHTLNINDETEKNIILKPTAAICTVNDTQITGIAYYNGKLRVQVMTSERSSKDAHEFMYLMDKSGSKTEPYAVVDFRAYTDNGQIHGRDYIFDIPKESIGNYSLYGDFITNEMLTKGNWKVSFRLENQ